MSIGMDFCGEVDGYFHFDLTVAGSKRFALTLSGKPPALHPLSRCCGYDAYMRHSYSSRTTAYICLKCDRALFSVPDEKRGEDPRLILTSWLDLDPAVNPLTAAVETEEVLSLISVLTNDPPEVEWWGQSSPEAVQRWVDDAVARLAQA